MKGAKLTKNFTKVPNVVVRDKALDLRSIGLLCVLLSLPPDWSFSISGLTTIVRDGRDAVRSGLKELERHGYIQRKRIRVKGRLGGMEISLTDKAVGLSPMSDIPTQAKPTQGEPTLEKSTQYKTVLNKTLYTKDLKHTPTPAELEMFEEWWKHYPRKQDKQKALKSYCKALKEVGADKLLSGAAAYGNEARAKNTEQKYIKMPTTWLNGKCWDDEYDTSEPLSASGIPVQGYNPSHDF